MSIYILLLAGVILPILNYILNNLLGYVTVCFLDNDQQFTVS